ncbi:MAG: hypothetical protein M3R27_16140 [Bacteroidota bacterium]|nr:hypothetical protein [Bacteroidota bacterium]
MKKAALALILVTVIILGYKPDGVVGKAFPAMECEDYTGKKINIPRDTKGKYTVLGMAFSNDAEQDLKTWINPVYNKFIGKVDASEADVFDVSTEYDIHLFFIPMFTGANQVTAKSSKEKIKKATDPELHPYVLFYEGAKTYKEELDFEKKNIPYFFVLDKTGKIVYATSGKYDDKKLEKIIDIIEEN